MPVNSEHPLYKAAEEVWEKCRDFTEGADAVKSKGTKYLPALEGQTVKKYDNYKQRAFFYNAVGRTVAALVGGAMRKLPAVKVPERIKYIIEDCTGTGVSLNEFIVTLMSEELQTARVGVLADRPKDPNGKPYMAMYSAESIINWGDDFFILEEESLVPSEKDKYEMVEEEHYRELRLNNGQYTVTLYKEEEGEELTEVEFIAPTIAGRPMGFIPFVVMSPTGIGMNPDKPPIKDLVDILASWYMVAADLAWANHIISCPTPWVTGIEKTDGMVLSLGMDTAWTLPVDCKVGFLEFQGQGLKSLEDTLSRLEAQMSALGARLLDTRNKTVIETATSSISKEASATSVTSQVIMSIEQGITRILKSIAIWEGADPNEVEVKLNRELILAAIDANMLNGMVQAVQAGTMSFETLYHNMSESGLTEPGVSQEDELARIATNLSKFKAEPAAPVKQPLTT